MAWQRFLLCVSSHVTPDQNHTRLITPQENLTLRQIHMIFLERFLTQDKCCVQRQCDNSFSGPPLLTWRRPSAFHRQRKLWTQFFFRCEQYYFSWFKRVTPSIESTMITCWGSYVRLSKSNTQEILRKSLISSGQFSST